MIWTVMALGFMSLLAICLAVGWYLFRDQIQRGSDLRRRVQQMMPSSKEAQALSLMRDDSLSSIPYLHRLLLKLPRMSNLQLFLHQAGSPTNPGTLALLCATLGCGGYLLGSLLGWATLHNWSMAITGFMAPVMWLKHLRKRRLAAFEDQFPEAVELMARALRAGHGLSSAIQMVGEEMEDPVAEEFNRTFNDFSYGKTLQEALTAMTQRVGLKDLKFFATAVILQRETGGNLTEILDNISHIIRERFRLLRQIKSLSAEGRLSGIILSLMAPALLVTLYFASPRYLDMLFNHPLGEMMLATGVIFQVLGMLVIKRLVTFKV